MIEVRILLIHIGKTITNNRQQANILDAEQSSPQTVIQIVIIIGGIIRNRRHLRLGTCVSVQFQIMLCRIFRQRKRQITRHRAVMFRDPFQRFFDCLAPTFGHMISLGQSNTIVSCPALTTHSEMDEDALRQANIDPATIRIALGDEDSRDLIIHFIEASRLTLEPAHPGFSDGFMSVQEINALIEETSMDVQRKYVQSKLIPTRC